MELNILTLQVITNVDDLYGTLPWNLVIVMTLTDIY